MPDRLARSTDGSVDNSKTLNFNETVADNLSDSDSEAEEPGEGEIQPTKANFVFGMHPMSPDNVVIDPNYPPQFFPYLYPHLYPHLFPHLYPHYVREHKKLLKKKKKSKKEHRPITVVLPDGRNILMTKKEFLAYQLALAQMGHEGGEINKFNRNPADDSVDELSILDNFRQNKSSPTNDDVKAAAGPADNPANKTSQNKSRSAFPNNNSKAVLPGLNKSGVGSNNSKLPTVINATGSKLLSIPPKSGLQSKPGESGLQSKPGESGLQSKPPESGLQSKPGGSANKSKSSKVPPLDLSGAEEQ